jgi:hypothetical protein
MIGMARGLKRLPGLSQMEIRIGEPQGWFMALVLRNRIIGEVMARIRKGGGRIIPKSRRNAFQLGRSLSPALADRTTLFCGLTFIFAHFDSNYFG